MIFDFRKKLYFSSWLLFSACIVLVCSGGGVLAGSLAKDPKLFPLVERLIEDGFEPDSLRALFSIDSVKFDPSGVALFFAHSESRLDYGQFLTKASVSKGHAYIKKYGEILSLAQEKYQVEPSVITSILLVETRLGRYLGRRNVLNTLSTMASLTDPVLVRELWNNIPNSRKPSKTAFKKKLEYRGPWAYKELKSLLKYAEREKISAHLFKGSYAGAMGIPQFIPSKAFALGVDGNGDGKVNLFDHQDAIFSVGNYLVHFGWKARISPQDKYKVLFEYNHSDVYVKTLMKLSEKLSR